MLYLFLNKLILEDIMMALKKTIICGVCGAQMNVKRNITGATSFAESIAKQEHTYDSFFVKILGKIGIKESSD